MKTRKKNLFPNSIHTRSRQENSQKSSKKIQKIIKTSSRHFFQRKRDEKGQKSENKILLQNSVHTRTEQENSEKK